MRTTLLVGALLLPCAIGLAQDPKVPNAPPDPRAEAPSKAGLTQTYEMVLGDLALSYTHSVPSSWWDLLDTDRFNSIGELRASLRAALGALGDPRARLLSGEEVEEHLCRLGSGYVGLGVRFARHELIGDGLLVKAVAPDSNAASAGLTPGIVIQSVNGVALKGLRWESAKALFDGPDGRSLQLVIVKDGETQEVSIKCMASKSLGLDVELAKPSSEFEVDWVIPGSPAEQAGIKEGDVVTHLNNRDVPAASDDLFLRMLQLGRLGDETALTLKRDGKPYSVKLRRSVVELWDDGFGMSSQNFDGPHGRGLICLTLKNLDWAGTVKWVDEAVTKMNRYKGVIIDLRGTHGDDPCIAARIAARFVGAGEVLRYTEGQDWDHVQFVVVPGDNGKPILRSICNGIPSHIKPIDRQVPGDFAGLVEHINSRRHLDQVPGDFEHIDRQALDCKLVVVVDQFTSGAAEALAYTLQRTGRARLVGGTTAGVNELVTTRIFTLKKEQFWVQLPTIQLEGIDGQPLQRLNPDRRVWFANALQTAKDDLAGRRFYNDPDPIVTAVLILLGGGLVVLLWCRYRSWSRNGAAGGARLGTVNGTADQAAHRTAPHADEPLTARQWLGLLLPLAALVVFVVLSALATSARRQLPARTRAELVAELHVNHDKHKREEALFLELAREIDGPITFKVVPDPDAGTSARITVHARWIAEDGKTIGAGSNSHPAASKEDIVRAIELAQTDLGSQYDQPDIHLIAWHRQTPVLLEGSSAK